MPILGKTHMEEFCQRPRDKQIAHLVEITEHLRDRQNMGMPLLFAIFEEHMEAAGTNYSELGVTDEEAASFQQAASAKQHQLKVLVEEGRLIDDEGNEMTKEKFMEKYGKDYLRFNRQHKGM